MASAFLGGAGFGNTGYLNAFNRLYQNIVRILPVYRFDPSEDKRPRVYVSTTTGSVTRHTDNRRQCDADFISDIHRLAFIPDKIVRD